MCSENRICVIMLFAALLLCSAWGVLHGEEWYLIPESEVQMLENIRKSYETDRLSWLSQVQKSQMESDGLKVLSGSLNSQLSAERETVKNLTLSFNAYEADQFQRMSQKDTEISRLKTENEKLKGRVPLAIIITIVSIIGLYLVFTILRRLKMESTINRYTPAIFCPDHPRYWDYSLKAYQAASPGPLIRPDNQPE